MAAIELFEIESELVRSALRETIKTLAKWENDQVEITSISKIVSNNVSGIVFRVSFASKSETTSSTSSLILKAAPQNSARRTLMLSREMALREIFIHNEVLQSITFSK